MAAGIKNRKEGRSWQTHYDRKAPRVGDIAPGFELRDVDGANLVRLSDFQGTRPVALIFGSFT